MAEPEHTLENHTDTIKQKNSNLSIMLLIILLFLVFLYVNSGYISENKASANILWLLISSTVLLAGYAFTYHGKKYRLGKWLFAIGLLACLAYGGLLLYSAALAHAFNH